MEISDWLALYDREQRRDVVYPDMLRQTLSHVVRYTRPAPGANFILFSDLAGADVDAVIREELEYFTSLHQPFEWKVYSHDHPADLKERLAAHGLIPDEPEAIMMLDLEQASSALLAPVNAEVRPISQRQDLQDVITVLEEVWGGDFAWVWDRLGAHLQIPGYLNVYVAYVGGVPASAAWIYFHPGSQFASLWGGSSREAYRRHGLYAALLSVRAQAALRLGVRYLTVDATPMSAPILEKHGFIQIATAWACEVKV